MPTPFIAQIIYFYDAFRSYDRIVHLTEFSCFQLQFFLFKKHKTSQKQGFIRIPIIS